MTPLYTIAHDIDIALGGTACADALEASTFDQSLVLWRFLAAVMRRMQCAPAKVQVAIYRVIAGMDRLGRGESWPKADAAAAWADAWSAAAAEDAAWDAEAVEAAWAESAWAESAWAATFADVPRETQRDILLRLIREASE
jgi:hypothetical protein